MEMIYHSQWEYLRDILELCLMRLSMLSEDTEYSWEQVRRKNREIVQRCEQTAGQGGAIGLEYLFRCFGLTEFEQHCVEMALSGELSEEFSEYYDSEQNGASLPTLGLCLQTFTDSAEEQTELLSRWNADRNILSCFFSRGLAEQGETSNLYAELKLSRRIVDFALDFTSEDPMLHHTGGACWPKSSEPMILRQELLDRMKRYEQENSGERILYYLYGEVGSGRRTLLRRMCAEDGRGLVWADLGPLMEQKTSWESALRPFFRETVIRHAALAVIGFEQLQTEDGESNSSQNRISYLLEEASKWTDRLFLVSESPWQPGTPCGQWHRTELHLDMPDAADRQRLWEYALRGVPLERKDSAEALSNKFALLPGQIAAAAEKAGQMRLWEGAERVSSDMLHQACRDQLSSRIGKLAARVNAAYEWDDLILPDDQKQKLMEACNQVEYRRRIYEEWGFGRKMAYGRGVSMLFSGPPGTGKTMAAQVIARKLQLELYKVDLSGIMSKYIGETEKQLGEVFDEVRKSQSILFFDEADAMFGRRSEIRDSHDRYANVQTSYLLQKIEEYDGIVILASNLIQNFDEAFKRRIKFVVEFTLPDQQRREQIWRSVMPPELPLDADVDLEFLARSYELSGSSIKNIAVAAAFMAAADGEPVNMAHLLLSVQAEQRKAGKSMSRAEFGEYAEQVQVYQQYRQKGRRI